MNSTVKARLESVQLGGPQTYKNITTLEGLLADGRAISPLGAAPSTLNPQPSTTPPGEAAPDSASHPKGVEEGSPGSRRVAGRHPGKPSPYIHPNPEGVADIAAQAREFLSEIGAAEERQFASVGHGTDFRYRSAPRPSTLNPQPSTLSQIVSHTNLVSPKPPTR